MGEIEMKRILVLVLSIVLALGTVTPVLAENGEYAPENGYENGNDYNNDEENGEENDYDNDYEPEEEDEDEEEEEVVEEAEEEEEEEEEAEEVLAPLPPAFGKVGYIVEYANDQLTINIGTEDEEDILVLNLGEGTVIIDAETGSPAVIADRETDRVKVYHSPIMTMSIPPQSPALVVALDLPENSFSPLYHVIEEIAWDGEDALLITVDNRGLIITLDRETPLDPHLTRQYIALEHLQVGDTLLFWYTVVGLSYPAQTTATRALFLHSAEVEDTDIEDVDDVEAPDYEEEVPDDVTIEPPPVVPPQIAIEPPRNIAIPGTGIIRDGLEFFPVRALADEAGFNVSWDSATSSAILTADGRIISLANNAMVFYVNGALNTLLNASFIVDGVMYAPYGFFYAIS
jgi:hypothetical protein